MQTMGLVVGRLIVNPQEFRPKKSARGSAAPFPSSRPRPSLSRGARLQVCFGRSQGAMRLTLRAELVSRALSKNRVARWSRPSPKSSKLGRSRARLGHLRAEFARCSSNIDRIAATHGLDSGHGGGRNRSTRLADHTTATDRDRSTERPKRPADRPTIRPSFGRSLAGVSRGRPSFGGLRCRRGPSRVKVSPMDRECGLFRQLWAEVVVEARSPCALETCVFGSAMSV